MIFLGLRALHDIFIAGKRQALNAPDAPSGSANVPPFRTRYLEAVAVSASNPKTVIFLSAFLPQFVTARFPVMSRFAVMFATIACIVCAVHAAYAYLLVVLRRRMAARLNRKIFPTLTAAIFIALGVGLGFST